MTMSRYLSKARSPSKSRYSSGRNSFFCLSTIPFYQVVYFGGLGIAKRMLFYPCIFSSLIKLSAILIMFVYSTKNVEADTLLYMLEPDKSRPTMIDYLTNERISRNRRRICLITGRQKAV